MAAKSFTKICWVSGNVSLPNGGFGPGELSLWHCHRTDEYRIEVVGKDCLAIAVCGLLMFSAKV